MKYRLIAQALSVLALTVLLGACSAARTARPAAAPTVPPKPITIPIGKNWQVIEEAPQLTDERTNRPAFQSEQSVQPPGAPPTTPSDVRKLETPGTAR
ncbi:hypothetical protein GMST_23950 [Geomonas silvestris]|uniref:Lipoprotein n=1 Tax=Geomonas silvestris TaxID=2740184 RepID=A0A6V8MJC6_9BACT|nr:hypothetical protein [Geomonas silvestris]GFO60070.1 hypothetical protein GMST_23950 [Geomonas silvestris]